MSNFIEEELDGEVENEHLSTISQRHKDAAQAFSDAVEQSAPTTAELPVG